MPTFTYRGYNASGHKVGGYLCEETQAAAEQHLETHGVSGYTVFRSETLYGDGVTLPLRLDELAAFCRDAANAFMADAAVADMFVPGVSAADIHAANTHAADSHLADSGAADTHAADVGAVNTHAADVGAVNTHAADVGAVNTHAPDSHADMTAAADLLPALAQRQTNRPLRLALFEIGALVARGYAPANAFAMYGHVFGLFFAQLAAAADSTAAFCGVLADLSRYYEREARFAQKARLGVRYPIIIGWLLCLALITVTGHGGVALGMLLICTLLILLYRRVAGFRRWADLRLATLPLARRVTMTLCTLRLARGLALLTRHGVPLSAFLDCARPLARNRAAEEKVMKAVSRMQSGKDLPATLEAFQYFAPSFPPTFYNALLQGYVSGNMADRLAQLCPSLEKQAESLLRRTRIGLVVLSAALGLATVMAVLLRLMG